jgi:hypothetical protein
MNACRSPSFEAVGDFQLIAGFAHATDYHFLSLDFRRANFGRQRC